MSDNRRWLLWCDTHLQNVRRAPKDRLTACCPVHDDSSPSLTVNLRTGWADCHAGSCGFSGSLEALARASGLPVEGTHLTPQRREPEASYVYRTAVGENYHQVLRFPGKEFRQQRWTGSAWEWKAPAKTIPYRLPELVKSKPSAPVIWVEGEKDADRAAGLKLLATTSPGGVEGFGKLDLSRLAAFEGRRVLVLPDNDPPGRRYALRVAQALQKAGATPRILDLAHNWPAGAAPVKADLSDWLDAGGTKAKLLELARAAFELSLDLVAWRSLVEMEDLIDNQKERLNASPPEPWEADLRSKRWALPACPWDRSHVWTSHLLWLPSGQTLACCSCCPEKDWSDLLPALQEPQAADQLEGEGWAEPVSLESLPGAEPFPLDTLPGWMGGYVQALARFTQTPPCLGALIGLAVLAAATAKKVEVQVREGWTEPVNLYTLVALPPGERKSWVVRQMTAPIRQFEKSLLNRTKGENKDRRLKREVLEAELKEVKQAGGQPERLLDLQDKKAAQADLPLPRLLVDDATSEALPGILAGNQGKVAVLEAEGAFLSILAGRYSRGDAAPALEVALKGYDGESIRVDRVSVERLPVFVEKPILTIGLAVQPDVVLRCAEKPAVRERGLLGRFIMAIPHSKVGFREIEPPTVERGVTEAYSDALGRVLVHQVEIDEEEPIPAVLHLQGPARQLLVKFMAELEPRQADDGDLGAMTDWAGKLVGKVARLAALLHVAEHFDQAGEHFIAPEVMERAIRIGRYAIHQAKRTYAFLGYNLGTPSLTLARKLWSKIQELGLEEFTKKHLHDRVRFQNVFQKADSLDAPLAKLESLNYLRRVEETKKARGVALRFRVNPRALSLAPTPYTPQGKNDTQTGLGIENGLAWVDPRHTHAMPTLPTPTPNGRHEGEGDLFSQVAELL